MRSAIGLGCIGVFVVGCYGLTPFAKSSDAEVKAALAPAADHANVILFVRTGGPRNGVITLDENRQCLAFDNLGDWYVLPMAPGRHELTTLGNNHNGKTIVVELAAGKTYVLEGKNDGNADEIPAFTPVKPGSREWQQLDYDIKGMTPTHAVKDKCPHWIDNYFYEHETFDKLLTALHESAAKTPPIMTADDGVVYAGSFESAKK